MKTRETETHLLTLKQPIYSAIYIGHVPSLAAGTCGRHSHICALNTGFNGRLPRPPQMSRPLQTNSPVHSPFTRFHIPSQNPKDSSYLVIENGHVGYRVHGMADLKPFIVHSSLSPDASDMQFFNTSQPVPLPFCKVAYGGVNFGIVSEIRVDEPVQCAVCPVG
jgi:hypothetical protein